jgi:hypothetical protein
VVEKSLRNKFVNGSIVGSKIDRDLFLISYNF